MGRAARALRRPASVALLGLAACLLAVPLAGGHGILRREGAVLHYLAIDPGIGAVVAVTSPLRGRVVFKDTTSPGGMDWGPCLPLSERRARCRVRGVARALIEVDDGPDIVHVRISLPAEVDGGPGDDWLTGGFGDDVLGGGAGEDLIEGGAGRDSIAGGAGSDTMKVRDGDPDEVSCGDGADTVIADPPSIDTISALELPFCEQVERGPARPDEKAPRVRVHGAGVQRLDSALNLRVTMSEPGSFAARGSVRLGGRPAGVMTPAAGRPDAPGQAWRVALDIRRRLAASIRRAFERGQAAVAVVSVRGRDSSGNSSNAGRRIRLRG